MVKKFNALSEALGDLDELNSILGLVRAFSHKKLKQEIFRLQNDLIEIGSFLVGAKEINLTGKSNFLQEKIQLLFNPRVKTFSRPGVNKVSAFLHLARACCRRLERRITKLKIKRKNFLVDYFNLLSKYLFWLAKKEEKVV